MLNSSKSNLKMTSTDPTWKTICIHCKLDEWVQSTTPSILIQCDSCQAKGIPVQGKSYLSRCNEEQWKVINSRIVGFDNHKVNEGSPERTRLAPIQEVD